jgi:hypothetical protein
VQVTTQPSGHEGLDLRFGRVGIFPSEPLCTKVEPELMEIERHAKPLAVVRCHPVILPVVGDARRSLSLDGRVEWRERPELLIDGPISSQTVTGWG